MLLQNTKQLELQNNKQSLLLNTTTKIRPNTSNQEEGGSLISPSWAHNSWLTSTQFMGK